jgi:hypothetical protein
LQANFPLDCAEVFALNPIRLFLLFAIAAVVVSPAHAQKEDWQPITQHDLEMKQVPGNPGADAIQLYYADFINDQDQTEFFYARIKVLNEKGKSHADVELIVPPEGSISGLKARTIQPDGRITEFTGKPFQKTVIKTRGVKVLAKAFTMPEVNVGSIIEYKYKIEWPWIIPDNSWTIQHELYTVKESFRMKPYSGRLQGFENGYQVAALYSHMPNNIKPVQKGGGYELDVDNMAAFESEGYMPPEEDLKPQMRFFMSARQVLPRINSGRTRDGNGMRRRSGLSVIAKRLARLLLRPLAMKPIPSRNSANSMPGRSRSGT